MLFLMNSLSTHHLKWKQTVAEEWSRSTVELSGKCIDGSCYWCCRIFMKLWNNLCLVHYKLHHVNLIIIKIIYTANLSVKSSTQKTVIYGNSAKSDRARWPFLCRSKKQVSYKLHHLCATLLCVQAPLPV